MLDDGWDKDVAQANVAVLEQDMATSDSLCYVVYSGGSTGE
jgi:hypothetical protein